MKTVALETSGWSGSVAAAEKGRLCREIELDPHQRTARTLAPALRQLLDERGWSGSQIELIAVTQGPGSFTGLRVGITTAKTLSYATGAALVGVDTLAVIARQTPLHSGVLWVVLNAERDQLFTARFSASGSPAARWEQVESTSIQAADAWRSRLQPGDLVAGSGLTGKTELIPAGVLVAPASGWPPRAATVAELGWEEYQAGRTATPWTLLPDYHRESAAVEKAAAQNQNRNPMPLP